MSRPKAVEFDSGVLNFDPATKKVTPDARRGKVKVFINADQETHFVWTDLKTNKQDIDIIVFQGDASFNKVKNSTGRVFYLKFESYDEKFFFWIQEKDTTKDDDICKRVNDLINFDPDAIVEEKKVEAPQPNHPKPSSTQVQPKTTGQTPAELAQLFQQAMANVAQGEGRKPTPDLTDILSQKFFDEILHDKEFQSALSQHLPEGQQNDKGYRDNIKSAQLLQALDALDEALNSDAGQTVLLSMGFDPSTFASASDGTEAFLRALDKWAKDQEKK